jgi:hypothetical protein
MNLNELLRLRISDNKVIFLVRLADWIQSNPGELLTEDTLVALAKLPSAMAKRLLHDSLYAIGGPSVADLALPIQIEWAGSRQLLTYRKTVKKTAPALVTTAPDTLSEEQWGKLIERIWRNRPWLIFPQQSERMRHCSVRWVRQEVASCLSWFQGKGRRHADWVATAYNWIAKQDDRAHDRASAELPSPAVFHRMAEENPEKYRPEVMA